MPFSDLLAMPKLGLTMEEGVLAKWHVGVGDSFAKGQTIFSVETDKIVTDIEASADGRVEEILVTEGQSAAVGAPVARLAVSGAGNERSSPREPLPYESTNSIGTPVRDAFLVSGIQGEASRTIATPRARVLAVEGRLDINEITGSGPGGRVKAADVERAIGDQQATREDSPPAGGAVAGQWQPANRIERSTAARLTGVKSEVPHFYLSTEVNVAALTSFRERAPRNGDGRAPSVTQLIVAAVARSVAVRPWTNRVWYNDGYRSYPTVDVGLAVHTGYGLIVPVVKDIGDAPLSAIGERMSLLMKKAKAQELSAGDVLGGAISVSNAGMHDVTQMISVISPGQSSIVGVGSIRRTFRPDAAGLPELREELNLTMSFDHRVFDGVRGLELLNAIKAQLELPAAAFA